MPLKGGASKALRAMQKTYGTKKGASVFYAKANKGSGKRSGKAMHTKASSYYKRGGKQR